MFTARLYERGMIEGDHLAVWTLQDALDGKKDVGVQVRNAYVKAASNWLLVYGDAVFAEVEGDVEVLQWNGWYDRLNEVTGGKWRAKLSRSTKTACA
jgi:hypothetical protein